MNALLKNHLQKLVLSDLSLIKVSDHLRQLKNERIEKEVVEDALNALRKEAENELIEDRILEILDLVTGFCSPHLRIWDK